MRWPASPLDDILTSDHADSLIMLGIDHVGSSLLSRGLAVAQASPPPAPITPEGHVSSQSALLVGLGFTAAVFAQIAGSVGLLLLKSSSLYEYDLPFWSRIRFFLGIFFQAIVPIGTDSFAYAVCPLSLLAPLSGITIAATIVFTAARCCGVREPVHASDFAVVVLIIAGVTLVNVYGPHSTVNVHVDHLASYLLNPAWLIFAGICGGLALLWLSIYVLVDFECLNFLRPPPTSVFMTLGCAFSAACCSMLAQVFLKVIAISVRSLIEHHPFEQSELAPVIVSTILLIMSALTNVFLINATMKSGKVIIAVPSYSSLTIVLTIIGSSIFYGDFNRISVADAINFSVGVAIVGIGIILLSILQWCRQSRKSRTSKPRKPSEGDALLSSKRETKRAPSTSTESYSGVHTERTPSDDDDTLMYGGDGASTFGDGASSNGDSAFREPAASKNPSYGLTDENDETRHGNRGKGMNV